MTENKNENNHLKSELFRANAIIKKLQNCIGEKEGRIASLEIDNNAMINVIQQNQYQVQQEKEEEKEE